MGREWAVGGLKDFVLADEGLLRDHEQWGSVGLAARQICVRVEIDPARNFSKELIAMDLGRETHPLADFQQNTTEFLRQLKETGEPVVLTVDGKAELVVQDAASYRKLLEQAEESNVLEGIRQGLEDAKAGRTIGLEEFKEHARKKHGISA
jgi:prevent-host-death family protein